MVADGLERVSYKGWHVRPPARVGMDKVGMGSWRWWWWWWRIGEAEKEEGG